jgi:glycosyltransferase involved in cell wall biosynthesis
VDHGKTGLRVAPYVVDELANAVIQLLQDDALRAEMGVAAPAYVAQLCEPVLIAKRYREIFTHVIEAS